jgi:hypothetical protein
LITKYIIKLIKPINAITIPVPQLSFISLKCLWHYLTQASGQAFGSRALQGAPTIPQSLMQGVLAIIFFILSMFIF